VRETPGETAYRAAANPEPRVPAGTQSEHVEASVLATCVGLGVLSAVGAYRFQQSGHHRGLMQYTSWRHDGYGGLSPEAASYLLAVQLVVRDVDEERLRRIVATLPEERRREVQAEMPNLDREVLISRLGLPPPAAWPPEQLVSPDVPVIASVPKLATAKAKPKPKKRSKHPVFRVRAHRGTLGAVFGGPSGTMLGIALQPALAPPLPPLLITLGAMAFGLGVGTWLGRSFGWDNCSDCEATLPDDAERCPGCDGLVVGRIAERYQRLAAREDWQAARRRERAERDDP